MNPDKSQPDDELKKTQPARDDDDEPGFDVIEGLSEDAAAALLSDDDADEPPAKPEDFLERGAVRPPSPETSAIDLRTQEMIELPFDIPDDDLLSDTDAPPRSNAPLSDRQSDSGLLDLHGSGTMVNPSDITRAGPDALPRPSSPDTDKLTVPKPRSSPLVPGLAGGLLGFGICAGLWYAGLLPGGKGDAKSQQVAKQPPPVQPPVAPKSSPAIESGFAMMEAGNFEEAATAIQGEHPKVAEVLKGLVAKAKADAERVKKVEGDIAAMRDEMAKAKPEAGNTEEISRLKKDLDSAQATAKAAKLEIAAAEAKATAAAALAENTEQTAKADGISLRKALKDTAAKVVLAEEAKKTAEDNQKSAEGELKKVRDQLASMKPAAPAAPAAPAVDPAEMEKLATARQQAEAKASALNEKLIAATNKLATANNMLATATAKLATVEAKRADLPPMPAAVFRSDVLADRSFASGLLMYRNNELYFAEREFEAAIKLNDRDARFWYFLGLTRMALGNTEQASSDFREGAEREKRNLPSSAIVDRSLERVPLSARQMIAQYRKAG